MGTRVTIYDIAREAGISSSTVSRVLNGSTLVNAGTRERVSRIAARLGYENRRTRRQATRAVLHVVVFVPNARDPLTHLFYDSAALYVGIRAGFGEVRAHLVVSPDGSTDALTAKTLGDIDGCLFAFTTPRAEVRNLLAERRIPAVLINRMDDRWSYVANDPAAGVEALLAEVHRVRPRDRVCFISVRDAQPVAGYRARALESASRAGDGGGDSLPLRWFQSVSSITCEAVRGLYDEGFRTFMCVNDFVATAVYERLLRLGLRVPEDVGLCGFDAAPVRGLLSRELTTVDLCVPLLGERAARMLVEMVMGRHDRTTHELIGGRLLRGDTL
jgi:LacI family transcriptional regulator